jgi:trimeric autotransporter adhesin
LASGHFALFHNMIGNDNLAVGANALLNNTTGTFNLALGSNAGANLTTGSNNIDIANAGVAGESGKIRIGTKGTHTATFLAGVSGSKIPGPVKPVVVNSSGRLGTAKLSSASHANDVRSLSGEVNRMRRQLARQAREIRQLRKEVLKRH